MAHPPRIPVLLGEEHPLIYFVTICESRRRPHWDNASFFAAFESAVEKLAKQRLWHVWSAVVMPDHLHLLASPLRSRDDKVGNLSGALKRWINQASESRAWEFQRGAFDRLLRTNEHAQQKWAYIRENPVRAGLVDSWQDWPWILGSLEEPD